MIRAIFLILAFVTTAHAQFVGECLGVRFWKDGVYIGCATDIDVPGADFNPTATGTYINLPAAGNLTRMGAVIGDETPACSATFSTTSMDMSCIAIFKLPLATTPTTDNVCGYNDSLNQIVCGDGTKTLYFGSALPGRTLGGTDTTNDFVYGGEDTSTTSHKCAANGGNANVCRGGTCSGTYPNGTCTLLGGTPNSFVGRDALNSVSTAVGYVLSNSTVSITAGTVTLTSSGNQGSPLIWRATGAWSQTGGLIDLKGKGTSGATSGTCSSTQPGKAGGASTFNVGGTNGLSGNNAGSAGVAAPSAPLLFPGVQMFTMIGGGGGSCPVSGQTGALNVAANGIPSLGGTGGGGGGCAGACSGTCGAGGAGGGSLWIESYTSITLGSSAIIDVRGTDGTTGGGGAGGGGVVLVSRSVTNNTANDTSTTAGSACPTGKICLKAGANGASPPTNCGAGAAGGNGAVYTLTVPQ